MLRKVGQNKCRGKFKMVVEGGISKILNEYKSKFKFNVCNVAIIEKKYYSIMGKIYLILLCVSRSVGRWHAISYGRYTRQTCLFIRFVLPTESET